jgi:hypothetical protein
MRSSFFHLPIPRVEILVDICPKNYEHSIYITFVESREISILGYIYMGWKIGRGRGVWVVAGKIIDLDH